ncbi:hypothetical protein TUM22923_07720 [Polynucleobacter sp. TUM22923]|nr:hypothetical protein TUM22923_07720 [Polynucleobacter sp. TUM22923]
MSEAMSTTLEVKLKKEAMKATLLALYFALWFCALAFLAATTLRERPIPLSIFGFALLKAGICAKFMMLAQAVYPINIKQGYGIMRPLLSASVFYLLVVICLSACESGLEALIHGRSFTHALLDFITSDPIHLLSISFVYWLIVWPYLIFAGMRSALGAGATDVLFFGKTKVSKE